MLVADIKIVPHGRWGEERTICRLNIANLGVVSSDPGGTVCTYAAWWGLPEDEYVRVPVDSPDVNVRYFQHRRESGAEACVLRAMESF